MNVKEFIDTTSQNFYDLTNNGMTEKQIICLLKAFALYTSILCEINFKFKSIFLALFIESQDKVKEIVSDVIAIDTSKIKPT